MLDSLIPLNLWRPMLQILVAQTHIGPFMDCCFQLAPYSITVLCSLIGQTSVGNKDRNRVGGRLLCVAAGVH